MQIDLLLPETAVQGEEQLPLNLLYRNRTQLLIAEGVRNANLRGITVNRHYLTRYGVMPGTAEVAPYTDLIDDWTYSEVRTWAIETGVPGAVQRWLLMPADYKIMVHHVRGYVAAFASERPVELEPVTWFLCPTQQRNVLNRVRGRYQLTLLHDDLYTQYKLSKDRFVGHVITELLSYLTNAWNRDASLRFFQNTFDPLEVLLEVTS